LDCVGVKQFEPFSQKRLPIWAKSFLGLRENTCSLQPAVKTLHGLSKIKKGKIPHKNRVSMSFSDKPIYCFYLGQDMVYPERDMEG